MKYLEERWDLLLAQLLDKMLLALSLVKKTELQMESSKEMMSALSESTMAQRMDHWMETWWVSLVTEWVRLMDMHLE